MDNVLASGLLIRRAGKARVVERARQLFAEVGMGEELWRKFPGQLSGGEAQRAAIVRALINSPRIVFADEPTGSLNSTAGAEVLDMLSAVNRGGQSVVMVTHDLRSALRGNRVVYLRDGVICGECDLGVWMGDDQRRHTRLRAFLAGFGW